MRNVIILIIGILTFANSLFICDIQKQQKEVNIYGEYTTPKMRDEIVVKGKDFKPKNIPLDRDLQEFTYALCKVYDMDYSFVLAVIEQESGFNRSPVNSGNYGLMQINEANVPTLKKNLGITDLQDPYNNIRAGVYMLHALFEKYGDKEKVLMAYNLGEGGAKLLWDRGIFETKYTHSVSQKQAKYQE